MATKKDINATLMENLLEYKAKQDKKAVAERNQKFAALIQRSRSDFDMSDAQLSRTLNEYRELNTHDQGRTSGYQSSVAELGAREMGLTDAQYREIFG